jgi:hypothetical protein
MSPMFLPSVFLPFFVPATPAERCVRITVGKRVVVGAGRLSSSFHAGYNGTRECWLPNQTSFAEASTEQCGEPEWLSPSCFNREPIGNAFGNPTRLLMVRHRVTLVVIRRRWHTTSLHGPSPLDA